MSKMHSASACDDFHWLSLSERPSRNAGRLIMFLWLWKCRQRNEIEQTELELFSSFSSDCSILRDGLFSVRQMNVCFSTKIQYHRYDAEQCTFSEISRKCTRQLRCTKCKKSTRSAIGYKLHRRFTVGRAWHSMYWRAFLVFNEFSGHSASFATYCNPSWSALIGQVKSSFDWQNRSKKIFERRSSIAKLPTQTNPCQERSKNRKPINYPRWLHSIFFITDAFSKCVSI